MQVLKFGGTSVANAENINKVVAIVKEATSKSKSIVVVSALGGVTDLLLSAASLAADNKEEYKEKLSIIEQRHLDAVKQLIPVAQQSQLLSLVKKSCNEIEDICKGSPPCARCHRRRQPRPDRQALLTQPYNLS